MPQCSQKKKFILQLCKLLGKSMLVLASSRFLVILVGTTRSRSNAHQFHYSFPYSHYRQIAGHPPVVFSSFNRRPPLLPLTRLSSMVPPSSSTAFSSGFPELSDEADFETILTPDGCLSICGFGSLLSERSARSTFPNLKNFRMAYLRGFRRVFAHAAPIFYERGIAREETKEVSSLSVETCDGEGLVVTVFEITRSEIPSFLARENEFRFLAVVPEDLDGSLFSNAAVVCARYSDEEYFQIRCKGNADIFFHNFGRYNIHKIWRDDILPCRIYLRHCVLAAKNLGEPAYNNFLDQTFLSDRKTSIREYLASTGSGIMEEEPPEALRSRYGG